MTRLRIVYGVSGKNDLARSEVHESIVMLFEHVTVSSPRTQFVHVAYDVILTISSIPISDWNCDD